MTISRGRIPWSGSTRTARLPSDWRTLRARILERDGHRCLHCGNPATDVDHIVAGDNHHDTNLAALCRACHRAKSAREGQTAMVAARHAQGRLLARPPEPHPGLITNRRAQPDTNPRRNPPVSLYDADTDAAQPDDDPAADLASFQPGKITFAGTGSEPAPAGVTPDEDFGDTTADTAGPADDDDEDADEDDDEDEPSPA